MTYQISGNPSTNKRAEHGFLDLIQEMKLLEIDIKPFFDIAANDILVRYGINAIPFAQLILDQMTEGNNPEGIYLWQELYSILTSHISSSQITLH